MRINRKSITALLLAASVIAGTGCRKYLDVNTNPNVAQDAPEELLLPSAQLYMSSALGVNLQINGSIWAQYWTQAPSSSQYKTLEQYQPSSSSYDGPWSLLYSSCLADLNQVEKKGLANKRPQYVAIARLLKAYAFQVATDGWGDVPFSEALKGLPEDGSITAPHYDSQDKIYDGLISLVQSARTLMNGLTPQQTISGDLIYKGNIVAWQRFANTLELKLFLRLSEKSPAKAQAGVTNIMNTAGAIGFIEEGQDAQINFGSSSGNQNPLFAEEVGLQRTQNLVGSTTVIDSMNSNNDYRAYTFFTPTSTGAVVGLQQGLYTASPSTVVSPVGPAVGGDAKDDASATAPVKFMTSYESYFLRAEAAARGWGSGNAEALFKSGITSSFAAYDATLTAMDELIADTPDVSVPIPLNAANAAALYLTGAIGADTLADPAYWAQYPAGGTVQQKLRHIITQKWFSMTGNQGFEAWTEWRRTGYPDFFVISANSLLPRTKAYLPRRFFYPDVEVQRNLNFPGQPTIYSRVYWDIH